MFSFARDNVEVDVSSGSALNKDLNPDVLSALSSMMIAQAANVFYRVMSDNAVHMNGKEHNPVKTRCNLKRVSASGVRNV